LPLLLEINALKLYLSFFTQAHLFSMYAEIITFNPILHTVWLDSHAVTLKNYTAKYYEERKI
jgi:hypothetical protein